MGNINTPISSLNTRYSIAALFLIVVLTMGLVITPIAFAPSALAEDSLCPLYGGNMRISWSGDVISFNTLINFWFRTTGYDVNVYDRLLKYGPNWELLPSLATSVKMEDGGKTHNISLRDDVKWHDGESLYIGSLYLFLSRYFSYSPNNLFHAGFLILEADNWLIKREEL